MSSRYDDLYRFYSGLASLEERLGGTRKLCECDGQMPWPQRGVYFFFKPGEFRSQNSKGHRVVRVGTHALKSKSGTSLWNRLSTHRGSLKSGGGNHRGSVFRKIVGAALCARDRLDYPSWGIGDSAPRHVRDRETCLEKLVSVEIGRMPFLWLAIDDHPGPHSDRGYIERNSIALLSNWDKEPIDPPSNDWLGHYSDRDKVRCSGLWNSNHVNEDYDPAFLHRLNVLIEKADSEK